MPSNTRQARGPVKQKKNAPEMGRTTVQVPARLLRLVKLASAIENRSQAEIVGAALTNYFVDEHNWNPEDAAVTIPIK
jgi:hypothetical protein